MKRAIGIDILEDRVCAIQMARTRGRICVERFVCYPLRRSTDQPSSILDTLTNVHNLDNKCKLAIAIRPDWVYYRTHDDKQDLAGQFPIPAAQLVTATYGRAARLVVGTARSYIEQTVKIIPESRLMVMEAGAFAVWNAVKVSHPAAAKGRVVVVHLHGSSLYIILAEGGQVVYVRSLPWTNAGFKADGLIWQVQKTYQRHFHSDMADARIYIGALGQDHGRFVDAVKATVIDPAWGIKGNCPVPPEGLVALGLGIRLLLPRTNGVDLLTARAKVGPDRLSIKRDLVACGLLAFIIMVTILANLWRIKVELADRSSQLDKKILAMLPRGFNKQAHALMPSLVLRRLQQIEDERAAMLDWWLDKVDLLQVWERIAATRDGIDRIGIEQLVIDQRQVLIQGRAASADQLARWAEMLKVIGKVRLSSDQQDASGAVLFNILIELDQVPSHGKV